MEAKCRKADLYLTQHGFELLHHNGQRISVRQCYATLELQNIEWNEIFIGKLPRDIFEDELLPHLDRVGPVYKIKHLLEFSKTNRGYCFVEYCSQEDAIKAIHSLNGLVLRPDSPPIGVKMSLDNKCLFFGNLPAACTEPTLIALLKKVQVEGVVGAEMADVGKLALFRRRNGPNGRYRERNDNRYCYVYFDSHESATKARRQLIPGNVTIFNRRLTCDWAKTEIPHEIEQKIQQQRGQTLDLIQLPPSPEPATATSSSSSSSAYNTKSSSPSVDLNANLLFAPETVSLDWRSLVAL